jgi:ABC-type uncharacterized transport system fused permease/ATPase subunit
VSGINIAVSFVNRDFMTAISEKDARGFRRGLLYWVGIIAVATPIETMYSYVMALLVVRWREWLATHLLAKFFDPASRPYYNLRGAGAVREEEDSSDPANMDNPDQRLCEDVRKFTESSVQMFDSILQQILSLIGFAGVLLSIAPELVGLLLVYAAFGTTSHGR